MQGHGTRIDPEVATYWRDHYDLRYIMERDWTVLGPKRRVNNAVYQVEDFLKKTQDPPAAEII